MPELGLFPLGVVLLPNERVPLHIFEPRYQELIGECLSDDREFGLVFADEDGVREVGTRASVAEVLEQFPDGRMNVVVEGGERFRVVELTSGRSFHTAEVEPVLDEPPESSGEAAVERALRVFRALAEAAGAEIDAPDPASALLSFELAARVAFEVDAKQRLLEERSESVRLALVTELLETALTSAKRARDLRERAARNGEVQPRDLA